MAPSVPPPGGPSAVPDDGASATATKYDFGFLLIPRPLRHDPKKPFRFGLVLNVLFGFASTFTVANLYYCQVRADCGAATVPCSSFTASTQ